MLRYLKDFCYEFRERRDFRLLGRDETLKRAANVTSIRPRVPPL